MKLKLIFSAKPLLFVLYFMLYSLLNIGYSQNLSFEELISLQKENQIGIETFLIKNAWLKDSKTKNKWIYKNLIKSDTIEAILTLQNKNCNKNIINYITSDSIVFNKVKIELLKFKHKKNRIDFSGSYIEDFLFKNLMIRFYEMGQNTQIPFYAVWVFSSKDAWYFRNLNNFCFPKTNYNTENKNLPHSGIKQFPVLHLDSEPEFPGGEKGRMKYLRDNVTYPISANALDIQGTVYVSFRVEIDGSISNIKILQGIGGGCDEEAIRIIKNMPRWKPAFYKGDELEVQLVMPLKFTLSD